MARKEFSVPTLDDKMSFGLWNYVGYPYDEEWLAVNSPDGAHMPAVSTDRCLHSTRLAK